MPEIVAVPPQQLPERILALEIVRVRERAAVGHGNKIAADQAAVDAMRRELNKMPIDGTIVIGEGERDKAPMLFIGEKAGNSNWPTVDITVDPLDGTTLCAKGMPGAIATMAMAEGGTLLNAPDVYMQKVAIGPGYAKGLVELDVPAADNIRRLAQAKGVPPTEITSLIMDRPRHADIIAAVCSTGAAVRLISDSDVAGGIHTADPENSGVDIYMSTGVAPRGGFGGSGIALYRRPDAMPPGARHRREARARCPNGRYRPANDLYDRGYGEGRLPVATGVTPGTLVSGVKCRRHFIETETIVVRSVTGTVRIIRGRHRQLEKYHLD
jgi:fructose-1,6-bisphosphatase II / sedoheptulose-1,7-bisphosphatase